jgi:ribonuclease-3
VSEDTNAGSATRGLPEWVEKLPAFPPVRWKRYFLEEKEPEWVPVEGAAEEEARLLGVEQRLGYTFQDRRLLRCALTSPGWKTENRGSVLRGGSWQSNKALEWLGDAVLYQVVTEHMVMSGEALSTGNSTPNRVKLISNETLAGLGEALVLWEALYLGVGERSNNAATGRPRYLACAVEAILGAVFLDVRAAGGTPGPVVHALLHRLLALD